MIKKIISSMTACAMSACLSIAYSDYAFALSDSDIMSGDVNNDKSVTAVDASRVLTEYSLTSTNQPSILNDVQKKSADVNSDGMIDARDASLILKYYAYSSVGGDISMEEFAACGGNIENPTITTTATVSSVTTASTTTAESATTTATSFAVLPVSFEYGELPTYTEIPFTVLNNNVPYFDPSDFDGESFEYYSELDEIGRCGVCMVCVGEDIMPVDDRRDISSIKPTGWHSQTYDIIKGKYLYNRCHLIGYQLTGENANRNNLITGTRYLNVDGMLPFENQTASYVETTHNHVLYRVTPVFEDTELVCRGVVMEAWSVEDSGAGVCFNVFCYNIQPGIAIDYASGESSLIENYVTTAQTTVMSATSTTASSASTTVSLTSSSSVTTTPDIHNCTYIGNKSTKKFHRPECPYVDKINYDNIIYFHGSREEVLNEEYTPCQKCNP